MGMVVESKFEIGQIVYLVTEPTDYEYMVTGLLVRNTHTEYMLRCGSMGETSHEEIEISSEKPIKINQ